MQSEELLKAISKAEIDNSLYDFKIKGISIYNLVKRYCRDEIMKLNGYGEKIGNPDVPIKEYRRSVLKSFGHLFKLFISRKRIDTIIRSFERIEFINGIYVDKFTDPLIDFSNINKNYVIIDPGRSGRHMEPRIHKSNVIFDDAIIWLSFHVLRFKRRKFLKQNRNDLEAFFSSLANAFPQLNIDRYKFSDSLIMSFFIISCYKKVFKSVRAKRLIAPARNSFLLMIPAAKSLSMQVLELQHGVTYSESLTYSGFIDPLFSPNYFLSFGKIKSPKCYGTTEDKIVEIGWAFDNYIKETIPSKQDEKRVLVISSPAISEKMVSITCSLASQNPSIFFYFRPHPNEQLDANRLKRIGEFSNVIIDNNLENISVTLMRFDNVIGENSTALYEALSMGKKVGRLNMEGLDIKYLNEEDKKYFYIISDVTSFIKFINSPIGEKPSLNIYTPFKPEAFNTLVL